MDSPLNRAHQQERKAEQLILSKKYLEAVTCYEVAAGYITEAMKATTASQALVSMQLQYEDHLRKQRLLKGKNDRLSQAKSTSDSTCCKETPQKAQDGKTKNQENMELLTPEGSDLSLNSISSLSSSQGVLVQEEDVISNNTDEQNVSNSMEDLQMQVLSLTQALEDCNRENNHLRNIILKFKEVLHDKLGFLDDQIEEMLIDYDVQESHDKDASACQMP